jgi:hypothetical protein
MGENDIGNIGNRTYKDLIHRQQLVLQKPSFMGGLAELLSYMIELPLLGHFLLSSFTVVCFALGRYRRIGNYPKLYKLLVRTLSGSRYRNKNNYRWWYLIRFGVAIAQERQINWLMRDITLEDNLIALGTLGPNPWRGYDVAYAFVGFSLWLFERGDMLGAIKFIKIAEVADDTWGYPEYLHGWYGLFTTGIDSIEHFVRAVQTDWSFLQRMKQDRTCRQHPEVLHEVQKRTLVSK